MQDLGSWFRGFLVATPVSRGHEGNGAFFKPLLTHRYTQLFQLYVIRVKVYCKQNMGNQRKHDNSPPLWYNQCWKKTHFFTQKPEFRTCIEICEEVFTTIGWAIKRRFYWCMTSQILFDSFYDINTNAMEHFFWLTLYIYIYIYNIITVIKVSH